MSKAVVLERDCILNKITPPKSRKSDEIVGLVMSKFVITSSKF